MGAVFCRAPYGRKALAPEKAGGQPAFFPDLYLIFCDDKLCDLSCGKSGLCGAGGIPLVSAEAIYYLRSFGIVFLAGGIGATPAFRGLLRKVSENPAGAKVLNLMEPAALALLLLVMTAYLVDGSFNPFLYFRF